MKRYSADYVLDGITEADFQNWKHHPVTKLYIRWLKDCERQVGQVQVGKLRSSDKTPDAFTLGTFTGQINTLAEVAEPTYQSIVDFYTPPEDQEES
jgi:hypothetical protein